jgi:hypothetical protein
MRNQMAGRANATKRGEAEAAGGHRVSSNPVSVMGTGDGDVILPKAKASRPPITGSGERVYSGLGLPVASVLRERGISSRARLRRQQDGTWQVISLDSSTGEKP